MVAGMALLGYDGDGHLDVYLVTEGEITLLENTSSAYRGASYETATAQSPKRQVLQAPASRGP
jgi:hypothetical protein